MWDTLGVHWKSRSGAKMSLPQVLLSTVVPPTVVPTTTPPSGAMTVAPAQLTHAVQLELQSSPEAHCACSPGASHASCGPMIPSPQTASEHATLHESPGGQPRALLRYARSSILVDSRAGSSRASASASSLSVASKKFTAK